MLQLSAISVNRVKTTIILNNSCIVLCDHCSQKDVRPLQDPLPNFTIFASVPRISKGAVTSSRLCQTLREELV
jgi:hypothetical protein